MVVECQRKAYFSPVSAFQQARLNKNDFPVKDVISHTYEPILLLTRRVWRIHNASEAR